MLQLAVTPHMEVANKVVFVSSSLWHWVRTTSVQTNLRGSQAPAPSHTGRCTSYEGLDRGCADFPLIRQMSPAAPPWCCLRVMNVDFVMSAARPLCLQERPSSRHCWTSQKRQQRK